MHTLLQDVRFAVRLLFKSPGTTAIALITLALGIGVNTGVFSMVNGMRTIPQRFDKPEELVCLWTTTGPGNRYYASALEYGDWREQATSFADTGIFSRTDRVLTGRGEPTTVAVAMTSASLLPMLGFDAKIGRLHGAEEDTPGGELVALLTDKLWHSRFGGEPDVLGRTIVLNDKPHTVIGILPPEAELESLWYNVDLFAPLVVDPVRETRERRRCQPIARLAAGVSADQAQAEMSAIAARLAQAYPETNQDVDVLVQPVIERFFSKTDRLFSYALLAAVGLVLLIACANLANLLLARASSRGREFAVRAALGAGRGRIIRQLLTESLLLALLGGALGLLLGSWAIDVFIASAEAAPMMRDEVGLSMPVLTYTFLMSLAAALFFGLTPALMASKVSLSETLKEGAAAASSGPSRNRLRNGLVIAQLAIALPLLTCGGLMLRHVRAVKTIDFGFGTESLITMRLDLPTHHYKEESHRATFYHDVMAEIEALPGVERAGATLTLPILSTGAAYAPVTVEGFEPDERASDNIYGYQVVTPEYFQTMGIRLITGRYFTPHDGAESQQVAIVNQRMASRYWPDDEPLGKRLTIDEDASAANWITVVGVVADAGCEFWGDPQRATLYLPHAQQPLPNMIVVARTRGNPKEAVPALRAAVRGMDTGIPVYDFRTVADIVHRWLRDDRMAAGFLAGLAALAMALASLGLYGVMSFAVTQRTHEIGVRVALGAGRHEILRLVLKRCLIVAAVGIVIGLALSAPVGLVLQSQLYGVSGIDPVTFIGVATVLLGVAVLAGYLPARRAAKVDPVVALRCE